ncbi:MAG: alpha/beta fold hydrolase [Vicinamibacterales bacterium]|jgi:homoserine O-acetyltransferase|nr:alpha/beta fold hydrolase [Vicinamibacterales bacterium]
MFRHAPLLLSLLLLLPSTLPAAEAPSLEFAVLGDFRLESGRLLRNTQIGYRTAGTLNSDRSNAVLFPTWFTGNTEALFTSDAVGAVDTSRFFLIAIDALANGTSTSPSNSRRQPDGNFPTVTIGDKVRSQYRVLTEVLDITHLHAVVGISMGGMQTYEWVTAHPDFVDRAVPIVGSPRLGSYDLLLWTAQLAAIEQAAACECDPTAALELTGMISQLALQTPDYHRLEDPNDRGASLLEAGRAGGLIMAMHNRAAQLRAMIAHDVSSPTGGGLEAAAATVTADMLVVVGSRDHMVTPGPALDFARLTDSQVLALDSDCGHMVTVCERDGVNDAVRAFLGS